MAEWQHNFRFDWDATHGRTGGAERTVWEILLEIERFKYQAGEQDQGAEFRGPGCGESLGAGLSSSGLGLSIACRFSQEDLAGALRVL